MAKEKDDEESLGRESLVYRSPSMLATVSRFAKSVWNARATWQQSGREGVRKLQSAYDGEVDGCTEQSLIRNTRSAIICYAITSFADYHL